MDCSMLGFPVHHQLLELIQTHVHWVGDAISRSEKVKLRWNQVLSWQHIILKRNLFLNLYREGGKNLMLVVCFLLRLKREIKKMSDTCSLFPPFGDPWPSCLLPCQSHVINEKNHWRKKKIWNVGNSRASPWERAPQTNSYTPVRFELEDGQLQEGGFCGTGGNWQSGTHDQVRKAGQNVKMNTDWEQTTLGMKWMVLRHKLDQGGTRILLPLWVCFPAQCLKQ